MRVEIAAQTDHPVPQFILFAENEAESAVIRMFCWYLGQPGLKPSIHGYFSNDRGRVTSFNFGCIQEEAKGAKDV